MTNTVALADWDSYPEETARDIKATGLFDKVILCVEDRHVKWRQENVREMIRYLHDRSIEVEVNGWGYPNMAGESTSTPRSYARFLAFANELPIDTIMVDEPSRHANLYNLLNEFDFYVPKKAIHIALEPENIARLGGARGEFDQISVSTYLFGKMWDMDENTLYDDVLSTKWEKMGVYDQDSVWLQTWGVPDGKESTLSYLTKHWQAHKMPINVWAWDAFRTVSSKRAANPDLVWRTTLNALASTP